MTEQRFEAIRRVQGDKDVKSLSGFVMPGDDQAKSVLKTKGSVLTTGHLKLDTFVALPLERLHGLQYGTFIRGRSFHITVYRLPMSVCNYSH